MIFRRRGQNYPVHRVRTVYTESVAENKYYKRHPVQHVVQTDYDTIVRKQHRQIIS